MDNVPRNNNNIFFSWWLYHICTYHMEYLHIIMLFQAGHPGKWRSSHPYGGRMLVNLLLHIGIVLSGLTWAPIHLMFSFVNIAISRETSYNENQRVIGKAVGMFYRWRMEQERLAIKDQENILMTDATFDSPGNYINRLINISADITLCCTKWNNRLQQKIKNVVFQYEYISKFTFSTCRIFWKEG